MNLKFSVFIVKGEDKIYNFYYIFIILLVIVIINNLLFYYMYMIIIEVFKIYDILLLYCIGRGYFFCIS